MGSDKGVSDSTKKSEQQVAEQLIGTSKTASSRSDELWNTTFPGLQQAENYYQTLSSGDPNAIARSIAPATNQIGKQTQAAEKRISEDMPRGGAKNLALEEAEINKGSQISNLATQSYLNSFQNLANIGTSGVSESTSLLNSSLGGLSAAGTQYSNIANQQSQGKAQSLGFWSSLAGSGASVGSAALLGG